MAKGNKNKIMLNESYQQYIVDEKGKKIAVILSVKEYEKIMEDLHDLAVVAERKDEPTLTFQELKNRLKKDGLL